MADDKVGSPMGSAKAEPESSSILENSTHTLEPPSNAPAVGSVLSADSERLADTCESANNDNNEIMDKSSRVPNANSNTMNTTHEQSPTFSDDAQENTPEGPSNHAASSAKKPQKRKSTGGIIPEHKSRKTNKRKSVVDMHLDVLPGEYWYARMKGHPPWPAIICDEDMLTEGLLVKRPVSAMRIDGTYREDFMEGGKNAKDRRYPVMFLGTNEFAWQVNTELGPLNMDDLKKVVSEGDQGKKSKSLWEAYKIAAEQHDLNYFKMMLMEHEKALVKYREGKSEVENKKQAKKEKLVKRNGKEQEELVEEEMMDVDEESETEKKTKPSRKRKKGADNDGETAERKSKTPKILKVNPPKTPAKESTAKPKKVTRPRKSLSKNKQNSDREVTPKAPVLSEAEKHQKREKAVLYLRHRLQKGFLTRDQAPKEEEMKSMSEYFTQLEQYGDLELSIIRATKINKVLKGIIKLNSIPKDEEYNFKRRSTGLLSCWNKTISAETEQVTTAEASTIMDTGEVNVNGVDDMDENSRSPAEQSPVL